MNYIPKKGEWFKATDAVIKKLHIYSPFVCDKIDSYSVHCHNIGENRIDFVFKFEEWIFEKIRFKEQKERSDPGNGNEYTD